MKWFIGCSGFNYSAWKENFYPPEIKTANWLTYYSSKFNSVELNGTFYRFPVVKNLRRFYKATPKNFAFSVKAHRIITHHMRMNNAKDKISEYMHIIEDGLEEKLHCVLFQFPASFKYNEENLERILLNVPQKKTNVIEFRDVSWWRKEVFQALKTRSLTFCNISFPELPEERHFTTDLFYMRFHGVPKLFYSPYSDNDLLKLTKEIPRTIKNSYIYFNNTAEGHAPQNSTAIKKMAE